jgi:flagellar basal-body rod protein FlgF
MLNSMFITLNGKYVLQRRMESITNNLANASTAGYKSSRPSFKMAMDETQSGSDVVLPNTTMNDLNNHIYFAEAPMVETGNMLDIAIEGSGFFAVSSNDGTLYTRNGQFTINKDRKLVTMDGSLVMGQGGEIIIDGKDIKIETDGSIYVDKRLAGVLKVVDFKDKSALKNHGRSYFVNTAPEVMTESTPEKLAVRGGCFESSNVNVMMEMVDMMSVLRAYESYTKVDQSLNDVLTKLLEVSR